MNPPVGRTKLRLGVVAGVGAALMLCFAAGAMAAPPSPPFHECPAVGADTSCAILIYISDSGAQILTDPSQHVYDGVEDTLIGVLNDTTTTTISSIPLSGSSDVFGFDGDGVCDPHNGTTPFSPGPPGANPGMGPCVGNTMDASDGGYGGPDSYFTNINGPKTSGTVNFISPLAPGQSTFFSLEGSISGADINVVTATASPINAVEGNPFTGTVANFHSTNTSAPASEFSASIDWGDGTAATPGTVTGSNGSFTVTGTHTYADEGVATQATITITDTSNGNTTKVVSPVTVADAPLTAGPVTTTGGVEGVTPADASMTFTDGNPIATASDFTASCDWGDGSTTTGTVTGSGGGPYTVSCASHVYAEEGSYTVTVNVTDDGGSTSSGTGGVTVADAPLASVCSAAPVSPQAFSGSTATFTDADPNGTVTDYTVSISWGDGAITAGAASGPDGGPFTASGSHTYASTGPFTITTTITDHAATTTAVCQTLIFAFAPGAGAFVIGDGNSAVGTSVNFWGPQWWKTNTLSAGAAPAAFKGYALNPATPSCHVGWSTDPGNSAPPPAGPLPAYMGVIVTSSVSQSGSQISGDTAHIVVVQTNAGYAPSVGHAGTGKVVAQLC